MKMEETRADTQKAASQRSVSMSMHKWEHYSRWSRRTQVVEEPITMQEFY